MTQKKQTPYQLDTTARCLGRDRHTGKYVLVPVDDKVRLRLIGPDAAKFEEWSRPTGNFTDVYLDIADIKMQLPFFLPDPREPASIPCEFRTCKPITGYPPEKIGQIRIYLGGEKVGEREKGVLTQRHHHSPGKPVVVGIDGKVYRSHEISAVFVQPDGAVFEAEPELGLFSEAMGEGYNLVLDGTIAQLFSHTQSFDRSEVRKAAGILCSLYLACSTRPFWDTCRMAYSEVTLQAAEAEEERRQRRHKWGE